MKYCCRCKMDTEDWPPYNNSYCRPCHRAYQRARYVPKPYKAYQSPKHHKPTKRATTEDIVWAAGFFEGDGTCSGTAGNASATQKSRWPLDKLREVFGGTVEC